MVMMAVAIMAVTAMMTAIPRLFGLAGCLTRS
jgi:hypothetical protein